MQIPFECFIQSLAEPVGWVVAKQLPGAANVRQRVADVAGPEVLVQRSGNFKAGADALDFIAEQLKELVECGALADCDVVGAVERFRVGGGGSQQVGLDNVSDVAEIAAGFAVAVNYDLAVLKHCCNPFWDYRGVGAGGVLARAEYVEIAEADCLQSVAAREDVGVDFIHQFGGCVGGKRFADGIFDFWEAGVVAIDGAAGGVDDAFDAVVAGGQENIEGAGEVGIVAGKRVGN